mgnify:CR=1 FL=1
MKHIRRILSLTTVMALCSGLLMSVPVMAAPPSIGSVSINPDPAYTDTPLTAIPSDDWFDADDDPEGYQYQWQIWDEGTTSWLDIGSATTDTLDSSNFDVGDEIKVICTPFDGVETGTPVEATIIISNSIVSITPDPAYTDDDLLATPLHWIGVDSFTYQWQIWDEGTTSWLDIGSATTDTLDSSNFIKDDQIKVICTPVVDSVPGTPVEATITISNSLPSLIGVAITPDPAYTDSLLEATPEGWFDADGDPEGYQWQWQKYNISTDTWDNISGATSNTLDNTNFTLNDQIKVICTPFDGTDTGTPIEAIVIITAFNYDAGIDVKPGSEENPINLKSKGVIPVAIYTTEGFDATTVDIETVKFGPNEAPPVHFAYEDIDDDGDVDLILHFRTQATGIAEDDTEVTLTGQTNSGMAFTGTDIIKIVPSKTEEATQGNESAPGQNKESSENSACKESAPGQNKEPGESAEGKAKGKDDAPGQNKEPGESAEGKGKNK